MRRRSMVTSRTLLAVVVSVCLTACSVGDGGGGTSSSQYALLEAPGWELRSRGHGGDSDAPPLSTEPALTWWALYERVVPVAGGSEGQDLRVSGHAVALDELVERTADEFRPSTIGGRAAATHQGSDGPVMVALAVGEERSVMVLSYALPLGDLRRLATTATRVVDESDWLDAVE